MSNLSSIHSAAPAPAPEPSQTTKKPVSDAQRAANQANAQKSTGPRTAEGKAKSSLNATRHGVLAQVLHLPEEEMAVFNDFLERVGRSFHPVGAFEEQLAFSIAELQFRLNRMAAYEHNLFALGHLDNGHLNNPDHPESHAALTFAETAIRSRDPLNTLSLYESRMDRRLKATEKQLREIQKERRALEEKEAEQFLAIAKANPTAIATFDPAEIGFVCSRDFFRKRLTRLHLHRPGIHAHPTLKNHPDKVAA